MGWESIAGALGLCAAVLALGWPLGSIVRGRLALNKDLDEALAQMPESLEQRKRLALEQDSFLRRVGILRRGYDVLTIGAYALACFVFGWPDFVASVGVPHGLEVLPDIAPYLALLCLSWINHWRVERAARGGWRLSAYMGFNLRGNAMMLAPVVLVSAGIFALRATFVQFDDAMDSFQFLQLLVQMGMMLLVVIFLPASIRYILPSTRLPEGPLRTRLTEFARARRLGVREIYVWNTRTRHIATAFVIGLIAPLRYVFITDALLRQLDEEEIEAVFAHELGHAHYNHLWWLLMFLFTVSIVLLGAATLVGDLPTYLKEQDLARGMSDLTALLPWAFTFGYAYVIFGYVSRRFERQADFFAVAHTRPEILARVFFKLGASSGHDMGKRGWRHFSLEQRIREIALVASRPDIRRPFNRELAMAISLAALITLASAAALWPVVHEDFVTGQMSFAFSQYDRARVNKAAPAELDERRQRVLTEANDVRDLGSINIYYAQFYTAVTNALAGRETEGFRLLATDLDRELKTESKEPRRIELQRLRDLIEPGEKAAVAAFKDGTSWYEELIQELRKSKGSATTS